MDPCFDLFCFEFAYELEKRPGTEGIAIALWRGAEQLDQLGGVDGGGEVGIAVEDEGGIGIVNGLVGDIARGRRAVVWREAGC